MRVITGTARGRKLRQPEGRAIRPTTEIVKEALFNIIQFDVEGRRVLDLFAGTGQLGIEALSRGAKSAVFVDESASALKLVRDNLALCGLEGDVVRSDAESFVSRGGKFDLIFLDPPYDGELLDRILLKIIRFDILSDGGIIICEASRDKCLAPPDEPYFLGKEYRYGKTKLVVFGRHATN
ncbi:MAG: 16S rRNA (guanine(966)-N(2))-methyltransferase RsmD [Oscillospiraceae bacterium]|jgi:16S rRNA (guanine(966)-N(2))-methyltransferase RsmD|nr:16S rRNA (guanine(966)-N(2))-methyltransferase RsmD [Oscillospiraceae bacterium]